MTSSPSKKSPSGKANLSQLWSALGVFAALLSLLLTTLLTVRVWQDQERIVALSGEAQNLREENTQFSGKIRNLNDQIHQKDEDNRILKAVANATTEAKQMAVQESQTTKLRIQEMEMAQLQKEAAMLQSMNSVKTSLLPMLKADEFTLLREGENIRIRLSSQFLFSSGDDEISTSGQKLLSSLAVALNGPAANFDITVEGHTDSTPVGHSLRNRFPTNWELSAARATAAVRYFQEHGKIDPTRLSALALGSTRPIDPGDSKEAAAKNRRIEILLTPIETPSTPSAPTPVTPPAPAVHSKP